MSMSAQISSQYVSGVLLAAPLAKAPLSQKLKEDKPISEPYIDMTLGMMKVPSQPCMPLCLSA